MRYCHKIIIDDSHLKVNSMPFMIGVFAELENPALFYECS